MNSHLSSDQICRWLAGERGTEEHRHLRDCPACQAELDQFQHTLTGFRISLEQSPVPAASYARKRQALPRWILATGALALIVAVTIVCLLQMSWIESEMREPYFHGAHTGD